MGNRRMISKTVTQTQRFLRLPLEAQALYFHLIQNSDDDGVVEAFPVVRMIGVSEDNLGLLIVKDFIRPLNDEMVYFITDFHEQNTVRKDRYSPSIYKHLLEKPPEKYSGLPRGNQTKTFGLPNISQYKSSQYNLSQSRSGQNDEDEHENLIFEKLKSAFGQMSVNGTMMEEVRDLLKIHGQELLIYALEVTILNAGKSIRYTRSILSNWQGQGLRTVEQVKQHEEQRQKLKQSPKQAEPKSVLFVNLTEILRRVRESFNAPTSLEGHYSRMLKEVDYLVLDDLGIKSDKASSKGKSAWEEEFVFDILSNRDKTIITTNLSNTEIASLYSDRVASRIRTGLEGNFFKSFTIKDKRYTINSLKAKHAQN